MKCYDDASKARKWRHDARTLFSRSDGFVCFDPTLYYEYGADYHKSEKEVMRFDLRSLSHSDIVLVNIKDIYQSVGTIQELMFAYLHKIPIIAFNPGEPLDLHPWLAEEIDRLEEGRDSLVEAVRYIIDYYS